MKYVKSHFYKHWYLLITVNVILANLKINISISHYVHYVTMPLDFQCFISYLFRQNNIEFSNDPFTSWRP